MFLTTKEIFCLHTYFVKMLENLIVRLNKHQDEFAFLLYFGMFLRVNNVLEIMFFVYA